MVQKARPISDASLTKWATSPTWSEIDEVSASDSDFGQSDVLGASETAVCRVNIGTLTDPVSATGHIVSVRTRRTQIVGTLDMDLTVRVKQGGVTKSTDVFASITTSWVTRNITLSAGEANAITDYDDLEIECSFTSEFDEGASGRAQWSWGELEVPNAPPPPTVVGVGIPSEANTVPAAATLTNIVGVDLGIVTEVDSVPGAATLISTAVTVGLPSELDSVPGAASLTRVVPDFPTAIKLSLAEFKIVPNTAFFQSDFTRTLSIQRVAAGTADKWIGLIKTVNMLPADARVLQEFIASLRGRVGTFTIIDPSCTEPQTKNGAFPGAGTVSGAGNIGTSLPTNWPDLSATVLMAGDRVQIESQYYMIVEDALTDGSGDVNLNLEPTIRTAPADGAAIVFDNPKLTARLVDPYIALVQEIGYVNGVAIAIEEAE